MQGMQVQSLGREDPLEKEETTHSSVLARKLPWKEEPGGLQSMGVTKRHNLVTKHTHTHTHTHTPGTTYVIQSDLIIH